jgi:hypothetical protein
VAFTAPSTDGGSTILSYTATSNPGGITGTLTQAGSGTITVSGLSSSTSYTFTVTATNINGTGSPSAASNSITTNAPPPTGQVEYTTPGTYSWVAPTNVTSVCVVCVGAGSGGKRIVFVKPGDDDEFYWAGAGGALAYTNNITVTPGQSYTVVVGAGGIGGYNGTAGESSTFNSTTCGAGGGQVATGSSAYSVGPSGGSILNGDGGGAGGACGNYGGGQAGGYNPGGGGAGGYSGSGGQGGNGAAINYGNAVAGSPGNGGGGGGGATGGQTFNQGAYFGAAGGGVGILGEGASGAGGNYASPSALGGRGGSGGTNGDYAVFGSGAGGLYGGGASMDKIGGSGAVRIIWGSNRSFPSTNTGNL